MSCGICKEGPKFPVHLLCCDRSICASCFFERLNSKCPFCKKEIVVEFNYTRGFEKKICEKHNKEVLYLLTDTKELFCQDCLFEKVVGDDANNLKDKIKKIDDKNDFSPVLNAISKLITLKRELLEKRKQFKRVMEEMKIIRYNEEDTLENGYIEYVKSYKKDYDKYATRYNEIAVKISSHIKDADLYSKQSELLLKTNDSNFRVSIRELSRKIDVLVQEISEDTYPETVDTFNFPDKIQPQPKEFTFSIPHFDRILSNAEDDQKKNTRYSSVFELWSVQWRVKVIANQLITVNNKSDRYTSVFIEVNSGLKEQVVFSYSIQLLHTDGTNKSNISRNYESKFKNGDSWGWTKMADCKRLLNENFLHEPDKSLWIKVELNPSSYQSAAEIAYNKMIELKNKYKQLKNSAKEKGLIPDVKEKDPHALKVQPLENLENVIENYIFE